MSFSDSGGSPGFPEYPSIELRHAGQWLSGGTPDTGNDLYWNGDIPWISAASMKNFEVRDSERRITELGVISGSRTVPQGAVIFVVRGMSLRNEFRVGVTGRRVAFGQDCKAIIPRRDIDARYLAYFLLARGDFFVRSADESGHGTKRLETRTVGDVMFPLLPLAEQRRIVGVLDALEKATRSMGSVISKLELVNQGVAENLLCDPISWRQDELRRFLATSPKNGFSPSEVNEWTGVQVLGLGCLTSTGFSPRHLKNVPAVSAHLRDAVLEHGDLLISRANTRELVGFAGCYNDVGSVCIYPDLMMRIRPAGNVLSKFMEHTLRSSYVRRQIQARAVGTSESMVKISSAIVRSLKVAVPDLSEQHRITSIIRAHDARIAAEREQLDKLRKIKSGLMRDLLTGRVRVDQLDDLPA